MGFTATDLNNFANLFESIGFREVEWVSSFEPIESFNYILSPITKNALWVAEIWRKHPGYQSLWNDSDRLLNIIFNEYDDMVISVRFPELKKPMIEEFNQLEDDMKIIRINTELTNIWLDLMVHNWLPKLCTLELKSIKPFMEGNTSVLAAIGPFDSVQMYPFNPADSTRDNQKQFNYVQDGMILFDKSESMKLSKRGVPLMVNPDVVSLIVITNYSNWNSLYRFSDPVEVVSRIKRGSIGAPGKFIIRTTIMEGDHEVTFYLDSDKWSVRFEDKRVVCTYTKNDMSSAFMIPLPLVIDVSWEPEITK